MQPEAELTLYAILDDHLEQPWVFVIEPPRLGEIAPHRCHHISWLGRGSFFLEASRR